MGINETDDPIVRRMQAMIERVGFLKNSDLYFYNQPIEELRGGARVIVNGRDMGMYASYSYLGLVGHPRINKAAQDAIEKYGTGTHGVRTLAGSLKIHDELEETIAEFKHADAAVTYTSGYVTNLTVISTLLGRGDYVFSDKINHASIVDGCIMSGSKFRRFRHNDMAQLENQLALTPSDAGKLIVADAVFSMDGDIIDFPAVVELAQKYNAWLMID
ncbi:MAG: aminotransferase class I/II-fold pyridoxal phosphate-dependent enzyme, partial [Anaerolineales bacterium]